MKANNSEISSFWNSFATKYDRFIFKNASPTYGLIIDKIKKELSNELVVLEIGSGTGLISLSIAQHLKNLTAIDSAIEMIKIAKSKQVLKSINNIDFKVGDASKLIFPKELFDKVIMVNVLHLLQEPRFALEEVHRVLKTDGQIIVPTYCHGANLKSQLFSRLMSFIGFKAYNRWSVKSFRWLIESNNFKVIDEIIINGTIPLSYITAIKK